MDIDSSRCKNLYNFFYPRGIAVVGASSDPVKPGGRMITMLRDFHFSGDIFPVNPGRKEIQGLPCYSSLAEIEGVVDLVVISLAAEQVPAKVRECAALGLHNIAVISAGFSEVGPEGAALQAQLAALVDEYSLNLLGPNCIGFINALAPAAASFSLTVDSGNLRPGPIGFAAQSGGLGVLTLFLADQEDLGISYIISTGNEAGLDFAEVISFLVQEPAVQVIGGYLEGVRDGECLRRAFQEAAKAGKPVVLLKAGDCQEAAEAISSHTGALAGSGEAYRAVFRQEGVMHASTMTEMLSLLKGFAPGRLPADNRAAVFSLSGGMGVLAADLCSKMGLELARFSDNTVKALQQLMPSIATVRNPLDPTAAMAAHLDDIRSSLELLLDDPAVDMLIFVTAFWRIFGSEAAEILADLTLYSDKPILVVWPGCGTEIRKKLCEKGVPYFSELKEGLTAAAALWRYASYKRTITGRDAAAVMIPANTEALAKVISDCRGDEPSLSETKAKDMLKVWGIAVPKRKLVKTEEEAVKAACEIGYPVVLKIVSSAIVHKTEIGGVELDLADETQLRLAWARMQHNLIERPSGTSPQGYLIEEMLPVQLELMAGVRRDPVFGPLMVLGIGGIFVELFRDLSIRPAPVNPAQVREMIEELKGAPLLKGFRGSAAVDLNRLSDVLLRFSQLAWELRDQFREIEINPLVVCTDGRIAAADALFIR